MNPMPILAPQLKAMLEAVLLPIAVDVAKLATAGCGIRAIKKNAARLVVWSLDTAAIVKDVLAKAARWRGFDEGRVDTAGPAANPRSAGTRP